MVYIEYILNDLYYTHIDGTNTHLTIENINHKQFVFIYKQYIQKENKHN